MSPFLCLAGPLSNRIRFEPQASLRPWHRIFVACFYEDLKGSIDESDQVFFNAKFGCEIIAKSPKAKPYMCPWLPLAPDPSYLALENASLASREIV